MMSTLLTHTTRPSSTYPRLWSTQARMVKKKCSREELNFTDMHTSVLLQSGRREGQEM